MTQKRKLAGKRLSVEYLEDRLCPSALAVDSPLTNPDTATQARASAAYGQLPLSFEANRGQTDAQVNFLSRGSGYTLFLTPGEAVLGLPRRGPPGTDALDAPGAVVRMQLVGGNAAARSIGLDALPSRSNYLMGNDPSQWHMDVTNYGRVEYQSVYPGIDLIYYGNQRQLEYDFVVAPGADPRSIRLAFQGAQEMALDAEGNLVLHTARGHVVEQAPSLYQEIDGVRHQIDGRYVLLPDEEAIPSTADSLVTTHHSLLTTHQVGFQVGAYDPTQPLIIDPIFAIVYSTYLGGRGDDRGYAIAVDRFEDAYATGLTNSASFPTQNPLQARNGGSYDVFVTKLNAAGTGLVYSTYLGGNGVDWGTGIAVDSSGNAYVTGYTGSTNFPTRNALQVALGGSQDAFVAELNASGSALLYSTYLGGSGKDQGNSVAVDGSGKAYVTGWTQSTDFPTANAFQSSNLSGSQEVFVTEIDPSQVGAASLVYSSYLGASGAGNGSGNGIAVDSSGDAYVTGQVNSANFPTTLSAFSTVVSNGFVTKFNATGSALVYSTFLGQGVDQAHGIAVDSLGNAYVTGLASGNQVSTPGAFQTASAGGEDAFMTELNATGSGLIYSTYLGGSTDDYGQAIAIDSLGNAYVTGWTNSSNFPTANAFQSTFGGSRDAFVAKINPSQVGTASLVYSTYLGGSNQDQAQGIAVDGTGNAYVTGYTYGSFPTTTGAFQTKKSGSSSTADAFVTKIDPPADAVSTPMSSVSAETSPLVRQQPASLAGPAVVFVASTPTSAAVSGSARDAVAALLAVPIEETMLQANPHPVVAWSPDHAATGARASLAETPAQPESSSTRRAQREEAVGPTLVSHVGHRAKAMSFAIEVVDAVFARSEWPPDPLLSDQALVTLD